MKKNALRGLIAAAVILAGCRTVAVTEEPATLPPASATPDVYATSASRTLAALSTQATVEQGTQAADPTATLPVTDAPTLPPGTEPPPAAAQPPAPGALIRSFTAEPSEIDPGDDITLSWEVIGGEVTLYRMMPTGQFGQWWDVGLTGLQVIPTADSVRNTITFTLIVTQDGAAAEDAMITVTVRCPTTWFFDDAPDSCPQNPPIEGDGAYQPFEHGFMFWVGELDRIFVLFDDVNYPPVYQAPDGWEEGMPEDDPDITPPAGLYEPVRGFGLVWRDESLYMNIRDRMGWATALETGYTASYQCNSAPKYTTCYLSTPEGAVIVLEPENSGWYVWGGP